MAMQIEKTEAMKTVAEITADMRKTADELEKNDFYDLRSLGTDSLRAYADLIDDAVKRELPQPDPNWSKICKECMEDGLPENIDCEWYGEPCGCNSPIYGEHPRMPHFYVVPPCEVSELVAAVSELRDGLCLHCDLQDNCMEGEDGMSTSCNAMATLRQFLDRYGTTKKENNEEELPF